MGLSPITPFLKTSWKVYDMIDVENRWISKDVSRACAEEYRQHEKPTTEVIPEILELAIEAAYNASIEFTALYDYAKFEEQQKLREVEVVEDVEVEVCKEEFTENKPGDIKAIDPRVARLLINRNPGIALKRFIKRQYSNSNSIITNETTHILRVESLQNGKRFNAVIDFEPIQYFPSGTVEKSHWPYGMIVDRKVPWSILNHLIDGWNWLDFKCRVGLKYKIIEMYGI
jgi:hypothetical protein